MHETTLCMFLCMYEFTITWELCLCMFFTNKSKIWGFVGRRSWNLQLQIISQSRLHKNTRRLVKTCSRNGWRYSVHMWLGNAIWQLLRLFHRSQELEAIGTACPSWSRRSAQGCITKITERFKRCLKSKLRVAPGTSRCMSKLIADLHRFCNRCIQHRVCLFSKW